MNRRILVACAPWRTPGGALVHVPCRVGISFWQAAKPMLTVVVKATASFAGDGPLRTCTFVEPRPLTARAAVEGESRPLPDDFVPLKPDCDVLLVGSVELLPRPSGELVPRHVSIRIGERSHSFTLASSAPGLVPLAPPYVVTTAGGDPRIAARPTPAHLDVIEHEEGFDWSVYNAAHPALRIERVPTGSRIVCEGLFEETGVVEIALPDVAARALCDWAREDIPSDAQLELDTIVIDTDHQLVDLVWRGVAYTTTKPRQDVDRVIVGWASDERFLGEDDRGNFSEVLAELPRGRFAHAWEVEDVLGGTEPPPLAPEDLEMARYETLDQVRAPSATISLEAHARIAAELVEEREPREKVLERHGFDEFGWGLEERALAERMASVPMGPGESAQEEYARHFVAAQEALATPDDDRFRSEDYVRITVGLEVDDPKKVLRDEGLTLGAWMRIDRAWQRRLATDAELEKKVNALFVEERARRGERKEPEVDDDGRIVA